MEITNATILEDVIGIKYIEKKDKVMFQKLLRTIPPLKVFPNGKEIPIADVEKAIIFMCKKWAIQPQWITPLFDENDTYYSVSVKETINHKWLGNCYAQNIYELYVKLAIKLYYDIKLRKIKKRKT